VLSVNEDTASILICQSVPRQSEGVGKAKQVEVVILYSLKKKMTDPIKKSRGRSCLTAVAQW